jgi:hypothetical protein
MTPAHEPTPEAIAFVRQAAAAGITQAQCARLMSISVDTLTKHYREQWDSGRAEATMRLGAAVLESAFKGDRDDRRFWLTHQGGWSQKQSPISVTVEVGEKSRQFIADFLSVIDRPKVETKPEAKTDSKEPKK